MIRCSNRRFLDNYYRLIEQIQAECAEYEHTPPEDDDYDGDEEDIDDWYRALENFKESQKEPWLSSSPVASGPTVSNLIQILKESVETPEAAAKKKEKAEYERMLLGRR